MALLLTRLFHCSNCHYTQPNREEQGREAQRDLSDFVAQDTKIRLLPRTAAGEWVVMATYLKICAVYLCLFSKRIVTETGKKSSLLREKFHR